MKIEKLSDTQYRISAPGGAFFNVEVDPDGTKNVVSGSKPPIGDKQVFGRYARLCDFTVVALTTPLQVLDALAKDFASVESVVQIALDGDLDFAVAPKGPEVPISSRPVRKGGAR